MKGILVRLSNLLTIKSIVTITLTIVFSVLCLWKEIEPQYFLNIYSLVIGFYFGVQKEKKDKKEQSSDSKVE
jgi:general stress protein CsbA